MRGFRLLVTFFFIYSFLLVYLAFNKEVISKPKHTFYGILKYNGRFYKYDTKGFIYSTASLKDAVENGFISCVSLDGLRINEEDFEGVKKITHVIRSQYTSEVCLNKRTVIMLKGIMVYFYKWGSLSKYFDDIERVFPYMVPRTQLELYDNGKLVILKGGWKWQNTTYSQQ